MNRKPVYFAVLACLTFSALACNFGQASNSTTDVQALVEKIPQHYTDEPQADKTFIGSVENSQTYVALVVQNDTAVVYLCDGDNVSDWFGGPVVDGKLDLTSDKGAHLVSTVNAESVTGTLTLADGQPLSFSAAPAVEGLTGLYRYVGEVDNVRYTTGWIIGPTGTRGETNSADGAQNGVIINIDPASSVPTTLQIRSDNNEYAIALGGVGYNLHALSVLQVPVNAGQNDFDYFCGGNKFFAGGILVPEGTSLIVDLVGDGCQAVASAPQANGGGQAGGTGDASGGGDASSGSGDGGGSGSGNPIGGFGGGGGFGFGSCQNVGFNGLQCGGGLGGFGGQFGNGTGFGGFGGGF